MIDVARSETQTEESEETEQEVEVQVQSSSEPPPFVYVRRPCPDDQCSIEKMITIEAVSLRRGGWRHSDGVLADLRHIDPKLGILLFFGVVAAALFFFFWRAYRSMPEAAMYSASGFLMVATTFSLLFGVDFFGAVGVAVDQLLVH